MSVLTFERGRVAGALAVMFAGAVLSTTNASVASAQSVKKALAASVVVPGTFSVSSSAVTQNSIQGNPCNPGACFDVLTTVHANRGWALQVTLNQTPANFVVAWIEKPQNIARPLTAGTYQTIATGNSATPTQNISVMYNANKTTGKGGVVPTAAQLGAVLSYRVVANP